MIRLKNMTAQGWTINARIRGEDVTRIIPGGGYLDVDSYGQVAKTLIGNRKLRETVLPDPAPVKEPAKEQAEPSPKPSKKSSSPDA